MQKCSVQTDFFQGVQGCFNDACAKVGSIQQFYQLAGCSFCLEFASSALAAKLSLPLQHLRIDKPKNLSFHIGLWDSASSGIPPPNPPWQTRDIREKGEIPSFSTDEIKAVYYLDPGVLNLIHLEEKKGFYWVADATSLSFGEIASPLRVALSFFMSSYQRQFIHAAAIGDQNRAILLLGKGGSGKSTTSLSCLDQGMQFLGDDYCVLSNDCGPRVHSLYAMGKLNPPTLAMFPSFQSLKRERGPDKEIIYLNETYLAQMPPEKPIKALFIPQIGNHQQTHIEPAPFSAALKALAPSTIFQLPGTSHATFPLLANWLKSVPSYFLHLSPDIKNVPKILGDFLRD